MLAEVTNAEKVEKFLSTFSKFIRYSFSKDRYDTTLLDELEHVKNYLRIHKNRVGKRLDYKITVTAEIKHIICPRFILQPIVENSIIHGLNQSLQKCMIQIRVFESENYTVLQLMKEQPKLPMSKVAYQVGYENPRHFYRVFKKYLGMTPGEFRKSGIAYEKVKENLEYITENKQNKNKNNFF